MAAVQACASFPNFLLLEYHANDIPWWSDLVKPRSEPLVEKGRIRVPSSPGLGIELDEDEVRKHLKKDSKPLP
jgi:L-alanine-DL-glutamate epimerase-like enolase superfamily enzyme